MITVKDIREKEFLQEKHGYSEAEVDSFLDELADQLEALIRENQEMSAQLQQANEKINELINTPRNDMIGDEPAYFKNLEATLRETLISAQRIADETVSKASKEAKQTIASAEEQAKVILASAKAESDAAKNETAEIRKAIEDYRSRFVRLVEEQANVLKSDLSLFE
ncbi:MAG: DivIVA domain-containing protein [Eubacteriales bacterium]|nr:DivIVA domain-containing protein [Eubacteriales bacterium]